MENVGGGKRVHRYGVGGGAPSGSGGAHKDAEDDAPVSFYEWAGEHAYGEEPLTEEEARELRAARSKEEAREAAKPERALRAKIERRGRAAEKRLGRPLTPREASLVARATRDAERRYSALTRQQKRKLEDIMGQQAVLKDRQRERGREVERRASEAGRGPGLTERAYRAIKADVEKQFAAEIREIEKQLKDSKAEMRRMLEAE